MGNTNKQQSKKTETKSARTDDKHNGEKDASSIALSTERQVPVIQFSDKASTPLELTAIHVNMKVTLPIARVSATMTFTNHHSRTLEGELVFPLPESATVVGYALDVNGTLVDAVPIEKEKAKVVFEEEVRSGKTVAIVEMVAQSNSFRTKVYPLHPNQNRTIKVTYTMPVSTTSDSMSEVFMPFAIPSNSIARSVTIEVNKMQSTESKLTISLVKNGTLEQVQDAEVSENETFRTIKMEKQQTLDETVSGVVVSTTQVLEDEKAIVEGKYFCARMKVKTPELTDKMSSDRVQIMWDTSYSRRSNNKRDIELLKKILTSIAPKEIIFTPFSLNVVEKYESNFSDVDKLIEHVSKVEYDGATNLENLATNLDESANYAIVFTDGLHNIGSEPKPETTYSIPMYIVSTSLSSNQKLLSHVATKSGGIYMNANGTRDDDIISQVGKPVLYFVVADYEGDENFEQVYPNEPTCIDATGYFHLFGIVKQGGEISVSFKYGKDVFDTKVFQIEKQSAVQEEKSSIIANLWANQKMSSLSVFPHLFKQELQELGREFSIVTPSTSLIVLEELSQYLKHEIVPPTCLVEQRKAYLEQLKTKQNEKDDKKKNKIDRVARLWQSRVTWHKNDVKLPEIRLPEPVQQLSLDDSYGGLVSSSVSAEMLDGCPPPPPSASGISHLPTLSGPPPPRPNLSSSMAPPPMAPMARMALQQENQRMSRMAPQEELRRSSNRSRMVQEETLSRRREAEECMSSDLLDLNESSALSSSSSKRESAPPTAAPSVNASINVQKWTSNAQYMSSIKSASDPYEAYLKERKSYETSPGFFLDVADYWLVELKRQQEGLYILTNIIELELESEQLSRIVGYRLSQEGQYALAEMMFEQVKRMRPDQPQSYRDLALVKEKLGKYSEALDLLHEVICGEWDNRYDEIELTALIELNHLLQKDSTLKACDSRFVYKMDLDLRISMAWDTDDTDIDLHVNEECPHGEHCYYGHNRTKIGGLVSRDFRHGFGPEEYMLKKALPGKFRVTARYFANHQQSLTGGTTILLTFFTNYLRENEQSQTVTVRLTQNSSDFHVCTIDV